ncbi:aminotransferase class I/II-fold pyridoxal phosphate-dependent enzyme [Bacillus sp. BHET2]|uniref:threonine aldolase family protein n=1 Tax=Bacillus sp. BHET2 TaxID=2583818 RepID=UPI00110DACC5|nr:GntG family PLP-dependent aldolase [Bacillus sp. BHET2]TMU87326.1 aminotransferase class I/II-fold pyridoxal phosphate-dependent enzyme [Bacillus sp. BHET2]
MIDLRSDTITKPTDEMRRAAYEAEVGDDVYGEDPTVLKLEMEAARILGKEEALFVTSGTQGNQIAVLTHTRPGNEILLEANSHIFYYESGAVAALAGVQTRTITGIDGAMDPIEVEAAIRTEDQHFPETGLICLENTHNRAGGAIVSPENMKAIHSMAKKHDIPVHVDGARLFNAVSASGRDARDFTAYCDTVQICLSKGLGAPIGSIIAGDHAFITRARKWRKRLGGGLRQVGMIAAPGLVALTTMRERLSEDHDKATILKESLTECNGIDVINRVDTNIVVADVSGTGMTSELFVEDLKKKGILAVTFGPTLVRFTTHYDVSMKDINNVAKILQYGH